MAIMKESQDESQKPLVPYNNLLQVIDETKKNHRHQLEAFHIELMMIIIRKKSERKAVAISI